MSGPATRDEADRVDVLLVGPLPTAAETTATLTEAGIFHALHVIEEPDEALAFLRQEGHHEQAPQPDLVLLDLRRARDEGRALLAELEQDDALRTIPVVVMSGPPATHPDDGAPPDSAPSERAAHPARSLLRAIRQAVDRRSVREQLLGARRMESIAKLTRGVAHDLNNLLTVMRANATLLEEGVDPADAPDVLREIVGATERGANLTRRLFAFSQRRPVEPTPIDLSALVLGMARVLRRALLPVTVGVDVAADTPRVSVDPSLLEQALLTLALDARESMHHGGRLVLSSRRVLLDGEQAEALHADATKGAFACIAVQERAAAAEASPRRAWDPLASARNVRGGLGLAPVQAIVRGSQGFTLVRGGAGAHTTFELYLPAHVEPHRRAEAPRPGPDRAPRRVLFVDDESAICTTACRILRRHGHTAVPAASGEEALARWDAEGPFDLVIADMSMPEGMTGQELTVALRRRAPGVPIVICSGHDPGTFDGGGLGRGIGFLRKPFRLEELLAAVDEATAST